MIKVLCLESNIQLAKQIDNILIQNNFQIISETNIEKGFQMIVETKPEIVILGLPANQTETWKLHSQIRMSEDLKNLPVLLITNNHQKYDQKPGLIGTALDDYIAYPFDSKQFLLRIHDLMNRANRLRE